MATPKQLDRRLVAAGVVVALVLLILVGTSQGGDYKMIDPDASIEAPQMKGPLEDVYVQWGWGTVHARTHLMNNTEKTALVLHGEDSESQNANYWDPLLGLLAEIGSFHIWDIVGFGESDIRVRGHGRSLPARGLQAYLLHEQVYTEQSEKIVIARSWGCEVLRLLLNNNNAEHDLRRTLTKAVLIAPTIVDSEAVRIQPLKLVHTLLIWGENDPMVPLSRGIALKRRLGNKAKLIVLRGVRSHKPEMHYPGQISKLILDFINLGHEEMFSTEVP